MKEIIDKIKTEQKKRDKKIKRIELYFDHLKKIIEWQNKYFLCNRNCNNSEV